MNRLSEVERHPSSRYVRRTLPAFVGRREQLECLEHSLQHAIGGRPCMVLIPGQTGIGKTRLLKEIRSVAGHHGVQVCYGRCSENLSLPYLPFVEALTSQWKHIYADVEHVLGADAQIMNRFLYRDDMTGLATGQSLLAQADQDKLRLFLTVSRTLIMLAQRQPMLFVIDDLHWADSPSLDLFGHLIFTVADTAALEPVPLLIIGTYRPEEATERLTRLVARLQREDLYQTLELPGLDESEMYALIQKLGIGRPSHQLVATIAAATQGNPLFIQEVVEHLRRQGALQERGGYVVTLASPADLQLPPYITAALAARLQGLSADCRRVLMLASLLGYRFTLQMLSAVSGVSEETLLDSLEEGVQQQLLTSERRAFQFAHPLVRHVCYHGLSTARRVRLHLQIAQALERLYDSTLDSHVLEIAHHLIRAGAAADVGTLINYARRAGDQAFAVFAWGDAAHYYEAALSAAACTDYVSPAEQADLHYWAGLAHYRDGDVGPGLDHYARAVEGYRLTGDVRGLAQALSERTRVYCRDIASYGSLVEVHPLEELLESLGESELELRGRIAARLSEVYWTARQTEKAEQTARHALAIAQRLEDDRLCAQANFGLGLAQVQSLHVREALQSWQDSLDYARRAKDLWFQGLSMTRMSVTYIWPGQLAKAEAVALEAGDLTLAIHSWGDYSLSLSALTCTAVARGDFDTAEKHAHEAIAMAFRSGYPWGGVRAVYALACAHALRGAWSEAEHALDMLVEPGRLVEKIGVTDQIFTRIFRQLLRAHVGACDEGMEQLVSDLLEIGGTDFYALGPCCALVELGDLMATPALVEPLYQVLMQAVERGVLFSGGWVFLIPRVLAVAATLNEWWEKAEDHFLVAISTATRSDARPELGRSYLDYARMLVARGGKSDRRRALELVSQARAIVTPLGMKPFARQALQLVQILRGHTILQQDTAHADISHAQEVNALVHIARSHTSFLE